MPSAAKTSHQQYSYVSFDATPSERSAVRQIVDRAERSGLLFGRKRFELEMDLIATHANGNPLRLNALLTDADDFNFTHDLCGIQRHLDRTTGKLTNCFRPRFSASVVEAA